MIDQPSRRPGQGIAGDIAPLPGRRPALNRSRRISGRRPAVAPRPLAARSARRPSAVASSQPLRPRRRWLGESAQYTLMALAALAAAYSSLLGQVLVGGYVAIIIWRRGRSQTSFGVALFLLATLVLFLMLKQPVIASHAALYTYELLVIGTAQAIWEQRKIEGSAN